MIKFIFILLLSIFITYMASITGGTRYNRYYYDFSEGPENILANPWGYLVLFSVIFFYFYKKEFIDSRDDNNLTSRKKKKHIKSEEESIDENQLDKAIENFEDEVQIFHTDDFKKADSIRRILAENGFYAILRCIPGSLGMPHYSLSVLRTECQQAQEFINNTK